MLDTDTRAALIAWLDWQLAMGADAAVAADAIDWTARPAAPPGQGLDLAAASGVRPRGADPGVDGVRPRGSASTLGAAPSRPPHAPPAAHGIRPAGSDPITTGTSRQFPTASPDASEASARRLAKSAQSLGELQQLLASFDGCALKATAKQLCFYRGAPQAPLMLIGEAPGRDEDLEGKPFVGLAGKMLDRMLAAAALTEADVHITNTVYWRPPGNRTPTPQEVQVCRPFLERQIELVAPRVIFALGGPAAKAVLDVTEGIMRLRGKWHDVAIGNHKARAIATLHPAFLLRTPAAKRLAWRDLLAVKLALEAS
jgi:DNA polymerase